MRVIGALTAFRCVNVFPYWGLGRGAFPVRENLSEGSILFGELFLS